MDTMGGASVITDVVTGVPQLRVVIDHLPNTQTPEESAARAAYVSRIVWVAKDFTMTPYLDNGMHLGTIKPPETSANCGWAEDGKTLCITARTSVYRIKLAVAGEKPLYQ